MSRKNFNFLVDFNLQFTTLTRLFEATEWRLGHRCIITVDPVVGELNKKLHKIIKIQYPRKVHEKCVASY